MMALKFYALHIKCSLQNSSITVAAISDKTNKKSSHKTTKTVKKMDDHSQIHKEVTKTFPGVLKPDPLFN